MFLTRSLINNKLYNNPAKCKISYIHLSKSLLSKRNIKIIPNRRIYIIPKNYIVDGLNSVADSSYYLSKGIILFTMFYCTMNWWHYRSIRKDIETDEDDKKKE